MLYLDQMLNVFRGFPFYFYMDTIKRICSDFLKDKYNIIIEDENLERLIRHTMEQYDPSKYTNQMEYNKMIISKVKEIVVNSTKQQNNLNEQSDFFSKLEELEIQRNAIQPGVPSATPLPPVVTPQKSVATPTGTPPSIIYVPTLKNTIKATQPLLIHGVDREWEYFPNRTIISWKSDLTEYSQIKVNSVCVPRLSYIHPLIVVKIKGVGDISYEIVCRESSTNSKWTLWKPCSLELSLLTHIPPAPWTILINDIYGELIDIGKDGATVIEYNKLYTNKYSIKLSNSVNVTEGDKLLLKRGKIQIIIYALRVLQNEIEIDKPTIEEDLKGMSVCNLNMQISILLETIKNEN